MRRVGPTELDKPTGWIQTIPGRPTAQPETKVTLGSTSESTAGSPRTAGCQSPRYARSRQSPTAGAALAVTDAASSDGGVIIRSSAICLYVLTPRPNTAQSQGQGHYAGSKVDRWPLDERTDSATFNRCTAEGEVSSPARTMAERLNKSQKRSGRRKVSRRSTNTTTQRNDADTLRNNGWYRY